MAAQKTQKEQGLSDQAICVLRIQKGGFFTTKSFTLLRDDQEILRAEGFSRFHTGTFQMQARNMDAMLPRKNFSHSARNKSTSPWRIVGDISSPGLFFDRSIVRDVGKNLRAAVVYKSTSRTGDLMNLKVAIPRIHEQDNNELMSAISTLTELPMDCAQVIVDHLSLIRAERIPKCIGAADCKELVGEKWQPKIMILRNKLPTWNAHINAFTLEFNGRARVPSVHNFQLVDENDKVVLQLGKNTETEYNLDFSFPLTPCQAFCACISVIERTFVWD